MQLYLVYYNLTTQFYIFTYEIMFLTTQYVLRLLSIDMIQLSLEI